MSDDADVTGDRMEAEMEMSRRALAVSNKRELLPLGLCYNCDEKVESKQLFCDADCRKDWERFNANRK